MLAPAQLSPHTTIPKTTLTPAPLHTQAQTQADAHTRTHARTCRFPQVLVVHLKRFSYSRYSRDKLDTPVGFPLEGLDLSRYLLGGNGGGGGGGGGQVGRAGRAG